MKHHAELELRRTAERLRAEYAHLLSPGPGSQEHLLGVVRPDRVQAARERLVGSRAPAGQLSLDLNG